MENITDILCDFAISINYDLIPKTTVEQTLKFITDYFAASFAGYKVNKQFNASILNVYKKMEGANQSSILFEPQKFPVPVAAFMNAIYAHGADMDDGNKKSAGHIGAPVMSAVFALAESRNFLWKDIIVAINVGYEFFNRIGSGAQPGLYNKGFHSTGVIGAVASAAACAKLLGLNKKKFYDSISIAAVQAGGLILIDESGQSCKPINPANATRVGVISALLSEEGIDAPKYPFESKKGWFQAFSQEYSFANITKDLGEKFTIDESYLKLYPSCRHTHSCIDAAIELKKEMDEVQGYKNISIKSVQVFIYPNAIKSAGTIVIPKTNDEAKFSIAYATAIALVKGGFKLEDLNTNQISDEVYKIAKLIEIIPDKTLENRERGIRGTRVQITLSDNTIFNKTILIPKGEGTDSLTWKDLADKLKNCAHGILGEFESQQLLEGYRKLDLYSSFSYPKLFIH